MPFRLLFFGDVVGEPGRKALATALPGLKEQHQADFVIVNGENVAGGRGITPRLAIDLLRAGASVITTGDHAFDQREIDPWWPTEPRLIRPLNYPGAAPGHGSCVLDTPFGPIAVLQAQGLIFMSQQLDNPIAAVERELERLAPENPKFIFVDFHAEATSEKLAFGHALDGRVSAVIGTHTHVQTADEQIFPGGTGYLTDSGMCGPRHSILGREIPPAVSRLRLQTPHRLPVATFPVDLCGAILELDETTGQCLSIRRLREGVEE